MQNSVADTLASNGTLAETHLSDSWIPTIVTSPYQVDTTLHITNLNHGSPTNLPNTEIYVRKGSRVSAFVKTGGQPPTNSLTGVAGTNHDGQYWTQEWQTASPTLLDVRVSQDGKSKNATSHRYYLPSGADIREYPGIPSVHDQPTPACQRDPSAHGGTKETVTDGSIQPNTLSSPTVQASRVFKGTRHKSCEFWLKEGDTFDYPTKGVIRHKGDKHDMGGEIEITIKDGKPSASAYRWVNGPERRKLIKFGRTTFIPDMNDDKMVRLCHFERLNIDIDAQRRIPHTAQDSIITAPIPRVDISDWLEHQKSVERTNLASAKR